ncbi:MAG: hypothetical protein HJJLKODD_00626 [Phycisphaerae bacterium]|nr:hypothetical protein [Phycisphaerae bacterium]
MLQIAGKLLSGQSAEINLISTVGLILASCFFLLKIMDVPWLRFRTDRRSVVTLLVLMLLLHVHAFMPIETVLTPDTLLLQISNLVNVCNTILLIITLLWSIRFLLNHRPLHSTTARCTWWEFKLIKAINGYRTCLSRRGPPFLIS